jgi:hypothetical protein
LAQGRIATQCNRFILLIAVVLGGTVTVLAQSKESESSTSKMLDSLQQLSQYIQEHLSEFTPAELKKQQAIRAAFQRQGYPNILLDEIRQDGWSAFVSYIKVHLFMEFSMEHKVFWIIAPIPEWNISGIPFPDDWSFSSDPWKRK